MYSPEVSFLKASWRLYGELAPRTQSHDFCIYSYNASVVVG
jgi:hypothetical protein